MSTISVSRIHPGSPEVAICARWRIEAFSVLGGNVDEELAALDAFAADWSKQVALMARFDGAAAGTCLLVPSEIDPLHAVSPWLAGLYVEPQFRDRGVGAALVRAIEAEACTRGYTRIYLYTDTAEPFYRRLGWQSLDRIDWKGFDTVLMARDLAS